MEYTASFAAGGLLYDEIDALQSILTTHNWRESLENDIAQNRFLKINSEASRKRFAQEIRLRMNYMTDDFWAIYNQCKEPDKKGLLFYVCLHTYKIIYDFHFNVTVPKFLSMETEIDSYWYEMRLQEISSADRRVNSWSAATKRKVITTYIEILRKIGLVVNNKFNPQSFSINIYCYCLRKGDLWALDAFFLKQSEKEGIIKMCNDN